MTSASRIVQVLVVQDHAPFRRFVCSILSKRRASQIIIEASDGLEAVRGAEELQPDLVFLDINLPRLNGIAAARRIRKLSPKSKIIFVSQEADPDVVQEAFSLGATGYVAKINAGTDLLAAMDAAVEGRQFVSARIVGQGTTTVSSDYAAAGSSPSSLTGVVDAQSLSLCRLNGMPIRATSSKPV